MRWSAALVCAVVLSVSAQASAQVPAVGAATVATSPAPGPRLCCLIPSGTPVEVEITKAVSSKTAASGERFPIRLTHDLVVDGVTLAPAGAAGMGEVIDVAPGGIAGRPGKLVLAARFVDLGAVHLPLRGFHLAGSGHDSSKAVANASVLPYVGILAVAIQGGNIDYAIGTRAMAKVAADTTFHPANLRLPAAPAPIDPERTAP